jgi:transcriptional regulator with XRE-family HTH domain
MVSRVHSALLDVLRERGLSDGALAARTGLSRVRVNRIKNCRIQPTVRDALLLSDELGVAVSDIFWLEEKGDE